MKIKVSIISLILLLACGCGTGNKSISHSMFSLSEFNNSFEFPERFGQLKKRDITNNEKLSKPEYRIILDDSLFDHSVERLAAWLAYGATRSSWASEGYYEANPNAKFYKYSFTEEFKARESLFQVWKESKEKDQTLSDDYLDDLLQVGQAGYLSEYVWYYFNTPEWENPSIELRMDKFIQWKNQHIKNHRPRTLAMIQKK